MEVWLDPQFRECDVVPNNWHGIHTVKGGYLYGRNIDKGIGIVLGTNVEMSVHKVEYHFLDCVLVVLVV